MTTVVSGIDVTAAQSGVSHVPPDTAAGRLPLRRWQCMTEQIEMAGMEMEEFIVPPGVIFEDGMDNTSRQTILSLDHFESSHVELEWNECVPGNRFAKSIQIYKFLLDEVLPSE